MIKQTQMNGTSKDDWENRRDSVKPDEHIMLDDLFWKFRCTLDFDTAHIKKYTLEEIQRILGDRKSTAEGYTRISETCWSKDEEIIKKFRDFDGKCFAQETGVNRCGDCEESHGDGTCVSGFKGCYDENGDIFCQNFYRKCGDK
jgi:hypothetical protein